MSSWSKWSSDTGQYIDNPLWKLFWGGEKRLQHNPMWQQITTRWQQWPAVASAPLLAFVPPGCSREAPGESRATAGIWALNKHVKPPSDLVLLVSFTCTYFVSMTIAMCSFREASHANSARVWGFFWFLVFYKAPFACLWQQKPGPVFIMGKPKLFLLQHLFV